MKKVLVVIVFLITFAIGFIPVYLYFTGYFDENNTTIDDNKTVVEDKPKENVISYSLKTPTVPLVNTTNFTYTCEKQMLVKSNLNYYSFNVYKEFDGSLILKDLFDSTTRVAKVVVKTKCIVDSHSMILVLSEDGDIYYLSYMIDNDIWNLQALSLDNLDTFKKVKSKVKFTNIVKGLTGSENGNFAQAEDGNFYDFTIKNGEYVVNKKYSSAEEVSKAKNLNIYDSSEGFNIYDDGKVTYISESNNYKEYPILDETGAQLYAYVLFPASKTNAFFLSLSNKIYSVSVNSTIEGSSIYGRLISSSTATTLSYVQGNRNKKVTLHLDGGDNFDFEDITPGPSLEKIYKEMDGSN